MNRIRSFTSLDRGEKVLVLLTMSLLIFAKVGLLFVDVERVQSSTDRFLRYLPTEAIVSPDRIPWGVSAGAHGIPIDIACLPQAIVGHALYSAVDQPTRIVLGVNREDDEFGAHAWVEWDDEVFIGDIGGLSKYHRLKTFDGS